MTTSKISRAVSTALMAVAAVGASAGALASTAPSAGPSDLFVAVWNNSTQESYVQDLGVTYSQLGTQFSTSGFTNSWNVGTGSLASQLGSGTYSYQLFAANYFTSTGTFGGNTAYLSLSAGTPITTLMQDGDLVGTIDVTGALNSYIKTYLPGSTTHFLGTTTGSGGNSWNANNLAPGYEDSFQINQLAFSGGATVGNPLNLIYYVASYDQGDSAASSVNGTAVGASGTRGIFNLDAATGLLTYSASPSTVPLPAAGWLLLSGLLGLLAVSRRRDAEAT